MNERLHRHRWISRAGYSVAALAVSLFVVYGSLVPLRFRPVPFRIAVQQFTTELGGRIFIDSNTDFVTNVLLGIPVGYLTLAALMTDRRGGVRRLIAASLSLVAGVGLALFAEFAQIFSQGRTDSASDVVAQFGGVAFGITLWLLVGDHVTAWLRESLSQRERPAIAQRILLAYSVLFTLTQLMPLDLTISLGQLAQKYRRGMILLRPFSYAHSSSFEMWWDYLGDVAINAPLGAAALLLWTRGRVRRSIPAAVMLGASAVAAIEFAQVFVRSRFSDTTDLITGSTGVVIGVAIAAGLTSREAMRIGVDEAKSSRRSSFARPAAVLWIAALMSYHWNPFNFTADAVRVTQGMHQLASVPFYSYYLGSEFHALTEMLRKAMLAVPLGVLLRLSMRETGQPRQPIALAYLSVGAISLLVIEVGQVFLPTRTPDITDPMIGELGIAAAFWLTGRLLAAGPAFGVTPSPKTTSPAD